MLNIKSPGNPDVKYKSNTIYTWNVTAPAETKEILIDIDMDIIRPSRGSCEDYLKVLFSCRNHAYLFLVDGTHAMHFFVFIIIFIRLFRERATLVLELVPYPISTVTCTRK